MSENDLVNEVIDEQGQYTRALRKESPPSSGILQFSTNITPSVQLSAVFKCREAYYMSWSLLEG